MVEVKFDFQTFFDEKNWRGLKLALNEYDSIQIAEILEDLEENQEIVVFRLLSREQAKEVFQLLSQEKQEDIIDGIAHNVQNLSNLLNDIEPDDRTAFLKNFQESFSKINSTFIA